MILTINLDPVESIPKLYDAIDSITRMVMDAKDNVDNPEIKAARQAIVDNAMKLLGAPVETQAEKKKLMLADNRVFDLGVDDLAALDAFILELKDDLDIPGYEEDLLRAMVMEADEASDALLEYGTIEPEQAAAITETREKYAAREEAAAAQAEEVAPAQSGTASSAEPAKRFILCPKCGERIWL